MRAEFPAKVRVAAFRRADGHCESCTAWLFAGKYHYDHVIPDQLGGEPTLENCQVLCHSCHGVKTAKQDVPQIAKAKRRELKNAGIRKPPAFRHPRYRRKISGEVVERTP